MYLYANFFLPAAKHVSGSRQILNTKEDGLPYKSNRLNNILFSGWSRMIVYYRTYRITFNKWTFSLLKSDKSYFPVIWRYMGLLFCLFDFVLFACFLNRKSLYTDSICPLRLSGIRKALPASQALIHVCVHVSLFVCYVDIKLAPNVLHKVSLYTKMCTKVFPKHSL